MLQVLSEMIRSEEFLGVIALAEFVHLLQMQDAHLPILLAWDRNRGVALGRR